MNYATKIKTAMASALCVMVGMAFAGTTVTNDVQTYGATFESTANGVTNDYGYANGAKIANYTNELGTAGWFAGSDDDESIVTNLANEAHGQVLLLNTDAETLTNKLSTADAAAVNAAMTVGGVHADASYNEGDAIGTYEAAVFESDVKFVASDTLDAGIPGGQDATKFAIYAYCNEDADPVTTNLVVFHTYIDKVNWIFGVTNEIFDVDIDTTDYTNLRIEMKKFTDPQDSSAIYNVFSVTVNGTTLRSDTASEVAFDETGAVADGIWFLTTEDRSENSNKQVSSLNFKGTGEIDNIKVSQKVKETYAAIVSGTKYASWETATNVAMNTANVLTSYESGKTLFLQAEDFISIANVQPVATNTVSGYKVETIAGDGFLTYTSKLDKATVIFLSDTGVELFRDDFQIGEPAVYGGTTPSKTADASGVYTWTGWTSGGVDYGTSDTLADVGVGGATYTATFSSVASQASVNGTYYATLADAIAAAGNGDTVILNADVTTDWVIVDAGDSTILDLNGHTLTANADVYGEFTLTNSIPSTGKLAGTVYVDGTTTDSESVIAHFTLAEDTIIESKYGIILWPTNNKAYDAVIDIYGTIKGCVWVYGTVTEGDSVINVYGTVDGSYATWSDGAAVGIALNGKATVNVYDGAYITASDAVSGRGTGIEVRAGDLNVTGGTIVGTGDGYVFNPNGSGTTSYGVGIAVAQHTTVRDINVDITGGVVTGVVAFATSNPQNNNSGDLDVDITGGEFVGTGTGAIAVDSDDARINGFVSGGTFSSVVEDQYAADGFIPVTEPNGEGKYEVTPGGTVTFKNGDVVLFTTNVVNGGTAVYEGATPTKAADASGVYTFNGWDPATIAVMNSADQTYTATFSKSGDSKATVITITDAGATTNVVGYYASLADAIRAAADGDTVVLLADETADATKTTQADRLVVTKQITIDFGPYTYSVPGSLEPTDNWCALFIDADTVVKGTTGGIDCLDEEDPSDPCGVYAFNVRNNAKLTIEGGVYHGGGTVIQAQLGTVEINGGTFSVTPYDAPYYYDFALNCVDANYKAGNAGFEINGGTFIGFDPQNNTSEGAGTDYTDDGYVAIDDGNGNFVVQAGYNVTFDANGGTPAPEAQRVAAGGTATAPAAPAKAGCTFAGWTLNNAAYNFATVLSADIELVAAYDAAKATVISVAGTVTNYYPTLAAAVAAAEDGDTVVLLANVNEAVVNNNAHSFTIDLNGKTWSADSDVLATTAGTITIEATNGGTMTTEAAQCCAVWAKGGDVVINGGTFTSKDNEEATIYVSNADSVITINGGTFENTDPRPYRWKASLQALTLNVLNDLVGQHLIINGGTFIGNDPQLGDDTAGGTSAQSDVKFVSEGYVAIADGNGNFVVQPGYNVTFDADGGTPAPEAQRVAAGGTATAPADPSKADGAFAGWTLAGNAYNFDTVLDADITLVATYEGYVAQIVGGASYTSLQAALDSVKENNLQQANIELLANASITISRNGNALGGANTTSFTINGNGYELNVIRNGTWAQFNTANANAELVISNITFTSEFSGTATGWASEPLQNPNHNIAFNCVVTLKDVVSDNALSFWKDATLDTVTVSESANVYPIWIHTTADEISINNLTVNSTEVGRGIKVDDSYVSGWGGTPTATTEIDINNSTFNMEFVRKSAVLVGSAYPVVITASGNDITNVGADTKNLVWVDERDSAAQNYGLVSVNGKQPGIEGGSSYFAASYSTNGTWIAGYYKVLADAVAIADADDTLTLQKDVTETFTVAKELTITLNGFTAENVTAGEGYTRTVTETTYVFAEAATGFNAGDDVDGVITQDQADWLNAFIDAGTYTKAQLEGLTGWQSKYLLNVDPFTGSGSITVSAITVGSDVKVTVKLTRTGNISQKINGTLYLYGASSLTSGFDQVNSAVNIADADFSEGNTTVITFTGTDKKFFKAVIK